MLSRWDQAVTVSAKAGLDVSDVSCHWPGFEQLGQYCHDQSRSTSLLAWVAMQASQRVCWADST